MRSVSLVLTITSILFIGAVSTYADTLTLPVTDDATVLEFLPDTNVGANNHVRADDVVGQGRLGFFKFDTATLAEYRGSDIVSAHLKLYVNIMDSPGEVEFASVEGSWNESAITASNMPPVNAVVEANHVFITEEIGTTIVVDITDLVKAWVDGTAANNGLAMRPTTESLVDVRIPSKEYVDLDQPAEIVVDVIPKARGKAYISKWSCYDSGYHDHECFISISNIADDVSTVYVTLVKSDGSILTDNNDKNSGLLTVLIDGTTSGTYIENTGSTTNNTVQFDLLPQKTILLKMKNNNDFITGFGFIEWEQNSQADISLIADVEIYAAAYFPSDNSALRHRTISVNCGLPF